MYEDDSNGETHLEAGKDLPPFDAPKYREAISDLDFTEEQAKEFLGALDFILRSLVDLGFGVDSVQNLIPAMKEISSELAQEELEQTQNIETFNAAALSEKSE